LYLFDGAVGQELLVSKFDEVGADDTGDRVPWGFL
jgi:hypothetical protein